MIRIFQRTWYGRLKCIAEFNSTYYDIVISSAGVLTIRDSGEPRTSVMALNADEWSVAKECD